MQFNEIILHACVVVGLLLADVNALCVWGTCLGWLVDRSEQAHTANLIQSKSTRLHIAIVFLARKRLDFINLFFIKILNFLSCRISFQSIPFLSFACSVLHFFCLYMAMLLLQLESLLLAIENQQQ